MGCVAIPKELTIELMEQPKKALQEALRGRSFRQVVEDLSGLGLRHVGYGIPVELLGVPTRCKAMRGKQVKSSGCFHPSWLPWWSQSPKRPAMRLGRTSFLMQAASPQIPEHHESEAPNS